MWHILQQINESPPVIVIAGGLLIGATIGHFWGEWRRFRRRNRK